MYKVNYVNIYSAKYRCQRLRVENGDRPWKLAKQTDEKARGNRVKGREGEQRDGIVDWMVTRCGKIATVGSHVPPSHVPRTGAPFREILRAYE